MMETNPAAAHAVMGGVIMVVALIGIAIMLIPAIFYCLTLQKALNRVSPENRAMQPGMVWLLFIPLFNIVWNFFVVLNMAKSLGAEFKKRNIPADAVINWFSGIATLVCWIMYWVKVSAFSNKLAAPAA